MQRPEARLTQLSVRVKFLINPFKEGVLSQNIRHIYQVFCKCIFNTGKFHYKSTIGQYIEFPKSSIENTIENRQPAID